MELNSFKKGIFDGLPICFAYFSVAFAFGIYTVNAGLTAGEALMISMTNVTSAGQLAAVPIIAGGGTIIELAACQFVINMRYALMSVSLSQKLGRSVTLLDRFIISFVNTDEVFAVATAKKEPLGKIYLYGLILTPYIGWSSGTLCGACAGNILPPLVTSSLGIAIYAMFIALILPQMKESRSVLFCVLLAVGLRCLFRYVYPLSKIPSGFAIIICAVAASSLFAVLFPISGDKEAGE